MAIGEEHISPIRTIVAAFGLSSFAGLVAHLREGKPWTVGSILVAACASGCMGAAITMIWYTKFQDNIYFLVGIVLLASLGGRPVVDAVTTDFLMILRRWMIRWSGIKPPEDPHDPDPPK